MIEEITLRSLIYNEEYMRKVIPFLKTNYYSAANEKTLFKIIRDYIDKFNTRPSKEALIIELVKVEGIDQDTYEETVKLINECHDSKNEPNTIEWLVDETELFCKKRAIHIALAESVAIESGESDIPETAIPDLLTDALGVCFDTHIGHDYLSDSEERWDFYTKKDKRIPFDLDFFNKITKGGVVNKSLNVLMGGTGTFKSGTKCHFAANYLMQGRNVLYITMELAEEEVARRIDANLLNVTLDDIEKLPQPNYLKKVKAIKEKTVGKLIIKEYPTSSAHVGHFRHLLKELKMKKKFMPDIIIIDYLNICTSSRIRGGIGAVNSYTLVKSIAEEVRGLAVEFNVPIWSSTQVNRSGFGSSDVGLEDTSESFGLPATADLFIAIIATEELDGLNQLMFKQLKNRYGDLNINRKFLLGVDKAKMRLYDLDPSANPGSSNTPKTVSSSGSGLPSSPKSFASTLKV